MNKSLTAPCALRLKRLYFRSHHRGCKETDLVFGAFAEENLNALDAPALDLYERLLDEDDADIWDWLVEKTAPPDSAYTKLLKQLRQYRL